MKHNRFARWLLPLLLLSLAVPSAYAGNGVLDQIQGTFQQASTGWMSSSLNLARPLFFGLAGLEFAWAAINYTLRKNDLGELLTAMTLKILGIAFFAMLLTEAPTWIPPIINSFTQAGQTVGGGGATSVSGTVGPSEILTQGIDTAAKVVSVANGINNQQTAGSVSLLSPGKSLAAIGTNLLSSIFIGMAGLMVILGFLAIAIQLLITTIESYIVIGGGALMLGFAGSRWTLPFSEKYFGYAVSVGIKLFTIYLVAGFGGQLANIIIQHWAAVQSSGQTVGPLDFLTAGATSLAYGAVGYMVPGIAGSMMNGSPSMSLANAGAAASGIAAAPVAGALAGGAAAMQAGGMAAGLFNRTQSAAKGGIGGSAMLPGGPVGGVSGTSRLESLASGAGSGMQDAGKGLEAARQATKGAGKATGNAAEAAGQAVKSAGDVVKSGAEIGKANAAMTQEAGLSPAQTTVNATPGGNGFASSSAPIGANADGPTAASGTDASAAQRQFESDNGPPEKNRSIGDKLKDGAQSLQHESNRRKPGLSHDGQSGGVSIRMNHID